MPLDSTYVRTSRALAKTREGAGRDAMQALVDAEQLLLAIKDIGARARVKLRIEVLGGKSKPFVCVTTGTAAKAALVAAKPIVKSAIDRRLS